MTLDEARQFIDAYCYDIPLPDAAERLVRAIESGEIYLSRTESRVGIEVQPGRYALQSAVDAVLYSRRCGCPCGCAERITSTLCAACDDYTSLPDGGVVCSRATAARG
jgi:hypothetical protein